MSGLLNTANKRIGYLSFDLVSGASSAPVVVRVTPAEGLIFQSDQSDALSLKAREHGTSDPFVDLADGIDLSDYPAGVPVDFDLVCEAAEGLTGLVRVALFAGVVSSGGAGWAA